MEHALPAEPPWPLQEGSLVRDTVLANSPLDTQRKVLEVCKAKGQGKQGKNKYKGKGKGPRRDDQELERLAAQHPPPAAPHPAPPSDAKVDQEPSDPDMQIDQREKRSADHLGDRDDRERNLDEGDAFQEAVRYRRGGGHLS